MINSVYDEFPVSSIFESSSIFILSFLAVLLPLIVPLIFEFLKFIINEEILSIMKSPSIFWFAKFKVTSPPFFPSSPHSSVDNEIKNIFEP